jgi:hypothetical protein
MYRFFELGLTLALILFIVGKNKGVRSKAPVKAGKE